MFPRDFLPFRPHRIAYLGALILLSAAFLSGIFLSFFSEENLEFSFERERKPKEIEPAVFSLGLNELSFSVPLPRVSHELIFSYDSPRPDAEVSALHVFVKIKKTGQSKRVLLPCRLDLEFMEGEKLRFSEGASAFWVELNSSPMKKIEGKIFIETPLSEKVEAESFSVLPQEAPIQAPHEFTEGSPFRFLSEAKWWGTDKFKEKYEQGTICQRIELGASSNFQWLNLQEGEWLIWANNQWVKGSLEKGSQLPIARIKTVQQKSLFLEGWDGNQYVHLLLNLQTSPHKVRLDELFNAVRVRSAKQISCMLEKQWLILKLGDWVVKNEGKWKILKKKEERELYQSGKLGGELFVFEKIESKGGQKFIQGQLFSSDRSQVVFSELAVTTHGMRKNKNERDLRGLGNGR